MRPTSRCRTTVRTSGTVHTDIQVRDGDLIYAISFISIPDAGMASLAVTVMRSLIAEEQSVCG